MEWKCSLEGETKSLCQSLGSAYTAYPSYLPMKTRPVIPEFFDELCKKCTEWHNSDEFKEHMKNIEKQRNKEHSKSVYSGEKFKIKIKRKR